MTSYITKDCLFCGPEAPLSPLYPQTFNETDLSPQVFSARRQTEHYHYAMVRCQDCRLVFSREILPDEVLEGLYADSAVTFSEYTDVLRRDYWRPLSKHVTGRKLGSALEIGCSSGFFLDELLDRGFRSVSGCEPSREAKAKASPRVRDRIHSGFFQGGETFKDERFDLICSFHTLDHVSDPLQFVDRCREALRPGGMVYFVTHDVDALQAKLLGEKSPIIDVEHIYLFNKRNLARLVERAGFRVLDVGNLKNSYPLRYWAEMMPLPKRSKAFLQGTLAHTGLGTLAPSLSAGNVFVIAETGALSRK